MSHRRSDRDKALCHVGLSSFSGNSYCHPYRKTRAWLPRHCRLCPGPHGLAVMAWSAAGGRCVTGRLGGRWGGGGGCRRLWPECAGGRRKRPVGEGLVERNTPGPTRCLRPAGCWACPAQEHGACRMGDGWETIFRVLRSILSRFPPLFSVRRAFTEDVSFL